MLVAGVDEVGRGPLAGPVVAGTVILDPGNPIEGLTDSKKLSDKRRRELAVLIWERAWSYVAEVGPEDIDHMGIHRATLLAMRRAVSKYNRPPDLVLVDGLHAPVIQAGEVRAIVKGDLTEPAISAASIIAKVHRDDIMIRMDEKYPGYGFARNSGYGTKEHLEALVELGPCPIHRRSFRPVLEASRRGRGAPSLLSI